MSVTSVGNGFMALMNDHFAYLGIARAFGAHSYEFPNKTFCIKAAAGRQGLNIVAPVQDTYDGREIRRSVIEQIEQSEQVKSLKDDEELVVGSYIFARENGQIVRYRIEKDSEGWTDVYEADANGESI